MDIDYTGTHVIIKKTAIKQIYAKYGELYDPYQSAWRDQGAVTIGFVGTYDAGKRYAFIRQKASQYIAPTGDELISFDGNVLTIPYSAFSASNTVQVEPENFFALMDKIDVILPLIADGDGKTGTATNGYHYFHYWFFK